MEGCLGKALETWRGCTLFTPSTPRLCLRGISPGDLAAPPGHEMLSR